MCAVGAALGVRSRAGAVGGLEKSIFHDCNAWHGPISVQEGL